MGFTKVLLTCCLLWKSALVRAARSMLYSSA